MRRNDIIRIAPPINRFPTSKYDYTLVTPMMRDAYDIVVNEVEKMDTGICMYSTSRFGKTRALDYIVEKINKEHPSVSTGGIIMTSSSNTTDKRFFMHVMESLNAEDDLSGNGDELRSRIERLCLTSCAEKQDPRLLIVIDEAQRINTKNYSYLIDLTNHLEKLGMAPTVFLVGQPELIASRNDLLRDKRRDAVGRFMENPIELEGVSFEDICSEILVQYDDFTAASFPAGSQVCITEAYLGNMYKKGFRLQSTSSVLWSSIITSARVLNSNPIIGMKSLTRVIEMALTELAVSRTAENAQDERWWSQILRDAGYLKHMKTISEAPLKT